MPESRGESFYGGRFYENTYERNAYSAPGKSDGWRYSAAFRGNSSNTGSEGPAAYVSSIYEKDKYGYYDNADRDEGIDVENDGTGQRELFWSIPGKHEVDIAFSTKDARHQVPTLLGMAGQHSLKRLGKLPGATSDLSKHSSKLVQKFTDMDVLKPKNSQMPLNSIDWESGASDAEWQSKEVQDFGDAVDFDRVDMGRQFARNLLRRPKRAQGEQLKIT